MGTRITGGRLLGITIKGFTFMINQGITTWDSKEATVLLEMTTIIKRRGRMITSKSNQGKITTLSSVKDLRALTGKSLSLSFVKILGLAIIFSLRRLSIIIEVIKLSIEILNLPT